MRDLLDVIFGRAAFDAIDLAQRAAALLPGEEQAGTKLEFADQVARHDDSAAQWALRMMRVAQMPILALVGDMEDALQQRGCVLHWMSRGRSLARGDRDDRPFPALLAMWMRGGQPLARIIRE